MTDRKQKNKDPIRNISFVAMETLSPPIITSTVSIPYSNSSVLVRSHGLSSLILRKPRSPAANPSLISSRSSFTRASAVEHGKTSVSIDLSDPNWKRKYEREFEERFSIPHITDVFPDAEAIRSTFCLKMRFEFKNFGIVNMQCSRYH